MSKKNLLRETVKQPLTENDAIVIADVQNAADSRQIAINKVGIKAIRHPLRIRDLSGSEQATVAVFNMYVNLARNVKGTHMSRFVEILSGLDEALTVVSFKQMLTEVSKRLGSEQAYVDVVFPYFIRKKAPVTGVESMLDYEVTLSGEYKNGRSSVYVKVVVPVTSLCPCSKKIAEYGAHNQRSHVTITVRENGFISIDELIRLIEDESSCELYGLLKRPDEKYITEKAYNNPKFVEDIVRDIAMRLNGDDRVSAYRIESENFESIHNHSAYACIEHDKRTEIEQ